MLNVTSVFATVGITITDLHFFSVQIQCFNRASNEDSGIKMLLLKNWRYNSLYKKKTQFNFYILIKSTKDSNQLLYFNKIFTI